MIIINRVGDSFGTKYCVKYKAKTYYCMTLEEVHEVIERILG